MAEAILRALIQSEQLDDQIIVDSAATGAWHVGSLPHAGTRQQLSAHGISYQGLRARAVRHQDLTDCDLVLAMDRENLDDLLAINPKAPVHLMLEWYPGVAPNNEVPDPYSTGRFEEVFALLEPACRNLLRDVVSRLP